MNRLTTISNRHTIKMGDRLIVTVTFILAFLTLGVLMSECLYRPICLAWGNEEPPTAVGVSRLAPRLSAERAREIGDAIDAAANEYDLDPLLVTSIAFRESSFRMDVTGQLGERGLMQIMPRGVALSFAPAGCRARQDLLHCSLTTGCSFLAHLRDEACPGSTWRYVAAYGRRSCPSEENARSDRGARRAFQLYQRAGGRRWTE